MISSHFRWDLHLRFAITVDAFSVQYDFISYSVILDALHKTMESWCGFHEADIFMELNDAFNNALGSSLVGDTSNTYYRMGRSQYQSPQEGISLSHHMPFSLAIPSVWVDVPPEYIEVVKSDLRVINNVKLVMQNQMLELQSQPTSEGSQPLSRDKICEIVLDRQPGYSKGLEWDP
ncbi:uncharacterized protein E5676_scaffold233G00170 [Cucumis melo var. makuwa]|uniref:CACTA en-spm transposon protein n=1 Tax=Cucumis melo var. makuwa TaxID=1194695 RepID=A0A5A7VIG0_CUCMM|nr:uncharacterized protein E6C27_scaffold38G00170 [Cucumis melo var. makuwa]TYJ96799.1 uncharacterized protein E5676_scaffold233G00170 [Cucumis melo var. makuwa]